jgi:hypothetical protein
VSLQWGVWGVPAASFGLMVDSAGPLLRHSSGRAGSIAGGRIRSPVTWPLGDCQRRLLAGDLAPEPGQKETPPAPGNDSRFCATDVGRDVGTEQKNNINN